jgi:hypothetical protein
MVVYLLMHEQYDPMDPRYNPPEVSLEGVYATERSAQKAMQKAKMGRALGDYYIEEREVIE